MVKNPVAYIIFNRPKITKKTFAVLRSHRPKELFIIADGPREGIHTDKENCAKVREIVEKVDWPCKVHRNYADANMGLKCRVSSGLNWVFKNVDRAIILEDDCIAHDDFFLFCDTMLERYATDERVSVITGNNFQNGRRRGDGSYYFSKYNHCWGWATWSRAWKYYQGEIPFWEEWSHSTDWFNVTPDLHERRYWNNIFGRVRAGLIDSWAYPWTASIWYKGGLTVTPNVNLVSNIGFGHDATHTKNANSSHANMRIKSIGRIKSPQKIIQDVVADRYTFNHHYGGIHMKYPYKLIVIIKYYLSLAIKKLT